MKSSSTSLAELASLFLKLGVTAFGGPAAHIAMMEDEVVRRRHWITREEFLDLLGATNLIPGPNSTELAIHIGHRRAGWAGVHIFEGGPGAYSYCGKRAQSRGGSTAGTGI
jgi:chromate transporter